MTAAGDLGDVHGQFDHPSRIRGDPEGADDRAQVRGHRRLQRQQCECGFLDVRVESDDVPVAGDDAFGRRQVGFQQRLARLPDRLGGHRAHVGELVGQHVQLLVKTGPHLQGISPSAPNKRRRAERQDSDPGCPLADALGERASLPLGFDCRPRARQRLAGDFRHERAA